MSVINKFVLDHKSLKKILNNSFKNFDLYFTELLVQFNIFKQLPKICFGSVSKDSHSIFLEALQKF